MYQRFPSIRISGDKDEGLALIPKARQELHRTKALAELMEVPIYERRFNLTPLGDKYIRTQVAHGQEFIYIYLTPTEEEPVEILEEEVPEPERRPCSNIYSGLSYAHQLDRTTKELTEFQPTLACRLGNQDTLFDAPGYQSVRRLGVGSNPSVRQGGSFSYGHLSYYSYSSQTRPPTQYNLIHGCQYSGPMAEIASIAAGIGMAGIEDGNERVGLLSDEAHSNFRSYVQSEGFLVEYDWKATRTHGACQDNVGGWWLLQIGTGANSGVYARRLPIIEACKPYGIDEEGIVDKYGGIPSGEAFPSYFTPDITGTYIPLLTNSSSVWSDFATEESIFTGCGWVFDASGRQARVVTYRYDDDGWRVLTYWRLDFNILVDENGEVTSASASMAIIESGIANRPGHKNLQTGAITAISASEYTGTTLPIVLFNADYHDWVEVSLPATSSLYSGGAFAKVPEETDIPCWVGYIDGGWHTINFRSVKIGMTTVSSHTTYDYPKKIPWGMVVDGFIGDYPVTHNGIQVPPETIYREDRYPTSNAFEIEDYVLKYKDFYGLSIAENYVYRGPHVIRSGTLGVSSGLGKFWSMGTNTMVHYRYHAMNTRIPRRWVQFFMLPYNRNGYYIVNYFRASGLSYTYNQIHTIPHICNRQVNYANNAIPDAFLNDCWSHPPGTYPYHWESTSGAVNTEREVPTDMRETPPLTTYEEIANEFYSRWSTGGLYNGGGGWVDGVRACYSGHDVGASSSWSDQLCNYSIIQALEPSCSGSFQCNCTEERYNRIVRGSTNLIYRSNDVSEWATQTMPNGVICASTEFDAGPGSILTHSPGQQFPLNIWVPGPITYSRTFYSWSWRHRQIYYGSVPELRFAFHLVANGINEDFGEFVYDGTTESSDLNNAYWYLLIDKDPYQQSDWRSFWCQVSTAGAYGAFYSDPYNAIFQDGNSISELLFPVKAAGTNPGLPNGVPSPSMGSMQESVIEDDMCRYLTFVGINGP